MAEILEHPQRKRARLTARAPDKHDAIRDALGEVESTVMRLEGLAFCQRELVRHNVDVTFQSTVYKGLYPDFAGLFHLAQTIEGLIRELIEQVEDAYAAAGSAPEVPPAS